ncbi:glycosyltransferase family 2 protein [Bradyrhizobium yuanmingense]|uniref:glycosyltransferase family 2 protein n=1 Tax=Bradyrhizobium yuanmingense TaxID=108015 RepID=UPI0023B99D35|nr:glycosyltransferase [Bradyrhizobium yuanmingense]MDF0578886.1 glycosyltransferase [Bradyrhizobium yuanmingense]
MFEAFQSFSYGRVAVSKNSVCTISIVISCYNYEEYVSNAIDSALAQTRPADEIIVLDDGSTDGSRLVISRYGSQIRSIFKENEGFITTVNRGYAEAEGTVVLFLDADDALYPEALEEIAKVYRPDASKIQYDLDIIDAEGKLLGRRFCNFSLMETTEATQQRFVKTGTYPWPVTSGNAHLRSFLDKVMPMTPPIGHDGVLNTIAPLYGPVVTIPRALGQYRLHNRNMNRQGGEAGLPSFTKSISNRLAEFKILREHAAALGKTVPPGNLLDNELTFVSYRLMARKLGAFYPESEKDSSAWLAIRGIGLTLGSSISGKEKILQCVWLLALLLAGRRFASLLTQLRFNRAEVKKRIQSRFKIWREKRRGL